MVIFLELLCHLTLLSSPLVPAGLVSCPGLVRGHSSLAFEPLLTAATEVGVSRQCCSYWGLSCTTENTKTVTS